MVEPRFSLPGCRENYRAHAHTRIEQRRNNGPNTSTDPHPTHGAENLTVNDEKGDFEEEERWCG